MLIVCCFLFTLVGTKFGVINKERRQLLHGQAYKLLNEVHLAPFWCRHEFKHNHGEWISSVKPVLDPAISAEIYETVETADTDIECYKSIRDEMRSAIYSLLKVMALVYLQCTRLHLSFFFWYILLLKKKVMILEKFLLHFCWSWIQIDSSCTRHREFKYVTTLHFLFMKFQCMLPLILLKKSKADFLF